MACVHYPLSERLQSGLALPSQILASNFPNNLCARMSSKLVTPILFTINLAQQATRMKEYEQSRARICAAKLVYVYMCSSSAASSGRPWENRSCIQSTGSGNQSKGSKRGFPVSKRRDIAGKGATCVPHKYCDSLATRLFICLQHSYLWLGSCCKVLTSQTCIYASPLGLELAQISHN